VLLRDERTLMKETVFSLPFLRRSRVAGFLLRAFSSDESVLNDQSFYPAVLLEVDFS